MLRSLPICLLLIVGVLVSTPHLSAAEKEFVPKPGEFPPANAGHYFAGELVSVDHINRRGALRLIGDNDDGRYHSAPAHRFAMLPYGTLRYHGAPAELRDIPIGTLVHGYFVLRPEESLINLGFVFSASPIRPPPSIRVAFIKTFQYN